MSDRPSLYVDFNDMDDDGRLYALLPPSMEKPARRTRLHLVDDDGNSCEGVVRLCESNGLVSLRVDWDTWVPAEEST